MRSGGLQQHLRRIGVAKSAQEAVAYRLLLRGVQRVREEVQNARHLQNAPLVPRRAKATVHGLREADAQQVSDYRHDLLIWRHLGNFKVFETAKHVMTQFRLKINYLLF